MQHLGIAIWSAPAKRSGDGALVSSEALTDPLIHSAAAAASRPRTLANASTTPLAASNSRFANDRPRAYEALLPSFVCINVPFTRQFCLTAIVLTLLPLSRYTGSSATGSAPSYTQWKNGLPSDPGFFPIAVWLQNPNNAARYKAAGINLYVGLWRGPTTNQLALLRDAGMPVICSQNSRGLENKDNPIIVGWMHGDEPDNAQSLGRGKVTVRLFSRRPL